MCVCFASSFSSESHLCIPKLNPTSLPCRVHSDILCREAIEATKKKQGKKFNLWYTVDRPSDSWKYSSGFINTEMIRDHMPAPGPDTLILMCGPPPMLKFACMPALEELGYTDDMIFAF